MPFIRKNASQGTEPLTGTHNVFIGRADELHFFVENILKPIEPTHNIISISGQAGVGKSTLLARFIDVAYSADFRDYCLAAIVDERQATSAKIMEKFADQLGMAGKFEKALKRYKATLHKMQTERKMMQDTILHNLPDLAGAAIQSVPIAGPFLREGVKVGTKHLLERYQADQIHIDAKILEDPLYDLTQAFVNELNRLKKTGIMFSIRRAKQLRVLLFFDTFEQLASYAMTWLLDYFLEVEINSNVVLIIAGRDPLEHHNLGNPKRWLPYRDNNTIYSISLTSFTQEETQLYLASRGITEPNLVNAIWQLSQGLALYLGLLTAHSQGKVDPTKDVVDNFLRWIPEGEHIKRRLALDAALFSRPFNQDDLEAFTYIAEKERPVLYQWVIEQSFVLNKTPDGRYLYHDLVQDLFDRHLYQYSHEEYYASRRSLANYYRMQLRRIQLQEGKQVYDSAEWLELALALIYQLLLMPDRTGHVDAFEQILKIHQYAKQSEEVIRLLRRLSQKQINSLANSNAMRIIQQILLYIEAKRGSQESLEAASFLLDALACSASFSPNLLADIYRNRGYAYRKLRNYQRAFEDFGHALELDPHSAWSYASRSLAYCDLKEYQHAFADCNRALELNPRDAWSYVCRSIVYRELHENQQAIQDCDYALKLNPQYVLAYFHRGIVYRILGNYQRAIADFDRALELDPQFDWAYVQRGITSRIHKHYQHAIDDFNYVLALDANEDSIAWTYFQRGLTYIWLNDTQQARTDFTESWMLDPTDTNVGWMLKWTEMCMEKASPEMSMQLEAIARINPQRYSAHVCQGVALWLRGRFVEALSVLEQAILLHPKMWDAYFWQGMIYASMKRDKEAIIAIEASLVSGLPPILLTPLHRFEQDRPDFYEKYVMPLSNRFRI